MWFGFFFLIYCGVCTQVIRIFQTPREMAKVAEEHIATAKSGKGIPAKRPGRASFGTEEMCLVKFFGTQDKYFFEKVSEIQS